MPNAPLQAFQYLDAFVIVGLSLIIGKLLIDYRRKNGNMLSTISKTVVATKQSSLVFTLSMLVAFPLYYAWVWLWVGPVLAMPKWFYAVVAVSAVAEMMFVLVPASSGWKQKVHEVAASFVGLVMVAIPLMFLIWSPQISPIVQQAIYAYIVACFVLVVLLVVPKYRKHTLVYEIIFCIAFWSVMSVAGHLS